MSIHNCLAQRSQSTFAGVWFCLWEHLHISKLWITYATVATAIIGRGLQYSCGSRHTLLMAGQSVLAASSALLSQHSDTKGLQESLQGLGVTWTLPILSYTLSLPPFTHYYLYKIFGKIDSVWRFSPPADQ